MPRPSNVKASDAAQELVDGIKEVLKKGKLYATLPPISFGDQSVKSRFKCGTDTAEQIHKLAVARLCEDRLFKGVAKGGCTNGRQVAFYRCEAEAKQNEQEIAKSSVGGTNSALSSGSLAKNMVEETDRKVGGLAGKGCKRKNSKKDAEEEDPGKYHPKRLRCSAMTAMPCSNDRQEVTQQLAVPQHGLNHSASPPANDSVPPVISTVSYKGCVFDTPDKCQDGHLRDQFCVFSVGDACQASHQISTQMQEIDLTRMPESDEERVPLQRLRRIRGRKGEMRRTRSRTPPRLNSAPGTGTDLDFVPKIESHAAASSAPLLKEKTAARGTVAFADISNVAATPKVESDAKLASKTVSDAAVLSAPLLEEETAAKITVAFADVSNVAKVVNEWGFCIVTGVADASELREMHAAFCDDVRALMTESDVAAESSIQVVRCEGRTVQNKQCNITSATKGNAARFAWPLKHGMTRCSLHALRGASSKCVESLGAPECDWTPGLKDVNAAMSKAMGGPGRCHLRGMPQGKFAWKCRLHAGVRRCFEELHGTSDLVGSMDVPFFSCKGPSAKKNRSWPHADQNIKGAPFACFQGVFYALPSVGENASTTVVWPKSHLGVYDRVLAAWKGADHVHWLPLSKLTTPIRQNLTTEWTWAARRLQVPAGALVLWDSRLIHQGWCGGPRLAQPVCFEPRSRRSPEVLERKVRFSLLGLPTTHWASLGILHPSAGYALQPPICAEIAGRKVQVRSSIEPVTLRKGLTHSSIWRTCSVTDPGDFLELLEMLEPLYREFM